jgi:hypothetical protein
MELANGRPRGTRMVHVCIRRTKHGTGLLVVRRVDGLGRETTLWKISFYFLGKNKLWKISEMANTDSEEHNDELDSSPISISRQKQLTRHAKHCKCCPHFSRAKLNMHACICRTSYGCQVSDQRSAVSIVQHAWMADPPYGIPGQICIPISTVEVLKIHRGL